MANSQPQETIPHIDIGHNFNSYTDLTAFRALLCLRYQYLPSPERDAIILKLGQHFPNAHAWFLKFQLSGKVDRNHDEGLWRVRWVQDPVPQGPERNAIVDELKREFPSVYIECLSEGLIETEGCDVI